MKTFEQALEEAAIKWCVENQFASYKDRGVSFKDGAQWAVDNLSLLDATDLLKHKDVRKLIEALDFYKNKDNHTKGHSLYINGKYAQGVKISFVELDYGSKAKARQTLAEIKEES